MYMKALTNFFDRIVQRFLPDAFLFAVILTLVVYVMGVIFTDSSPIQMNAHWGGGFWELLDFAMQMALIVTTGYILANTSIVRRILTRISKLANTPAQAIILVTIVASIASLINYGFGLVVGALLAIYVARRVPSVNFRLLVASAYSGFLLWHGGFSASEPLLVATELHFLEDIRGIIPVVDNIFSSISLFIFFVFLVTYPILNWLLPRPQDPLQSQDQSVWETNESNSINELDEKDEEFDDTPATR